MTSSTVIFFLVLSLLASDIIPSEARYKSYSRRRAARFLKRRQLEDGDVVSDPNTLGGKLNDMVMTAVSAAVASVVNDPAFASCAGVIRRRQADLDDIDLVEDDPDIVDDDLLTDDIDDDLPSKRSYKRRLLRARRRSRNTNMNVNQNYNLSARKEETNPSAEASNEEETTTEVSSRRRRRNFK